VEYETEITVPAGTKDSDPAEKILTIDKGTIRGWVDFPFGCANAVKVRIYHGTFMIAPFNKDDWLRGTGTRVPFGESYDLKEPPYSLRILASSPGTKYEHKPLIHVSLLPTWMARPEEVLSGQLKQLKERLDDLGEKAEEFMEKIKALLPRQGA